MVRVSAETFQNWRNKLPEKVTVKAFIEHRVQMFQAPFCAMRHVKYFRCLPGDVSTVIERSDNPKEQDAKFS